MVDLMKLNFDTMDIVAISMKTGEVIKSLAPAPQTARPKRARELAIE
jgi:hypothetical protein